VEEDDFLLSVEEVALAMSMVGQPEVAHDLMLAQLGTMKQEEARVRLLTAGHSLMAQGWLTMDAQGAMHLADPLARVARVLSRADFSIRYSRSHREADLSLSFHFGERGIFAHRIEQGVLHHVTEVQDTDAVIQDGLVFFEMAQVQPFVCSSDEIPVGLLDEVKDEKDVASILHRLEATDVPEETRMLLAEDLHRAQYRGSILRVEYGEDNVPRSDRGLLVLRGPERLWLLRQLPGKSKPSVTPLPGTERSFRQEVAVLLSGS
jgi:hypothetical protein